MNPDDVDFCLQCLLVFVYRETVTFQFSLSFVQSVKLFFCLTDLINLRTMDAMLKSLYFDLKQVRQKNQQHDIYPRCMYLFMRVDPRYISFSHKGCNLKHSAYNANVLWPLIFI